MEFQVILSPRAERDLEQIGRYIAVQNEEEAKRFTFDLLQEAKSLRTFPGRAATISRYPHVRKIPFSSYLIFYTIQYDTRIVEILRFWHAAQSPRHLRLREETTGYALATTSGV